MTGFTDAEGSFMILIRKNPELRSGWEIRPAFSISLHEKDLFVLEAIKVYFGGIGRISKHGPFSYMYVVTSVKQLSIIMDHFDNYGLITQKLADYLLFKMAFEIIKRKAHLSNEGLQTLVAIKASLNLGLSDDLKAAYPDINPVPRPFVENLKVTHPEWMAGFASGDIDLLINYFFYSTIIRVVVY